MECIGEIGDYEPNTRMTSRMINALQPTFNVMTFEPGQGGTRVTQRFDSEFTYNNAFLGSSAFRWLIKRRILAVRRKGWAIVKQILETTESVAPQP